MNYRHELFEIFSNNQFKIILMILIFCILINSKLKSESLTIKRFENSFNKVDIKNKMIRKNYFVQVLIENDLHFCFDYQK